jgi:hypothetical protein
MNENRLFVQSKHIRLLSSHFPFVSYLVRCYSDTRGVTTFPPNRNLVLRFGWSSGSNRNNEQSHVSSLWQDNV